MRRPTKSDSNLFAMDFDAIETTLRDANESLVDRSSELLAALSRMPASLETEEDIGRANLFSRQFDEAIREARRERLADGRPFKDATATVKRFFDEIEAPLKAGLKSVLHRLTEAARGSPPAAESAMESESVGIDVSGETIVSVKSGQSPRPAAHAEIQLVWSVESFDREKLDMEVLRRYLTDAVLLAACRKHLADHGPQKLAGVSYQKVARPR